MNQRAQADLNEQTKLIMRELRCGEIDIDQFMKLLNMIYGDYYDSHPEDHPYYAERKEREREEARRFSSSKPQL